MSKGSLSKLKEGNIISVILILFFLAGLFFISPNLTGNAIGNIAQKDSSFLGSILIFTGVVGFFINRKFGQAF